MQEKSRSRPFPCGRVITKGFHIMKSGKSPRGRIATKGRGLTLSRHRIHPERPPAEWRRARPARNRANSPLPPAGQGSVWLLSALGKWFPPNEPAKTHPPHTNRGLRRNFGSPCATTRRKHPCSWSTKSQLGPQPREAPTVHGLRCRGERGSRSLPTARHSSLLRWSRLPPT